MSTKPESEIQWEKQLGISTGAANFEKDDPNHSRYEPTSYAVLQRLAESGYLTRDHVLVDYGCGKGRVGFFLNYALGLKTIGVEYSERLFHAAQDNLARYSGRRQDVSFVLQSAEEYEIREADSFYFFNPFSVKILEAVMRRILESYYDHPRRMQLFFYYATDPYISWLMTESPLEYAGEIDLQDLFHNEDSREKILMFRLE